MTSTFNEDIADKFRQIRRSSPVLAYVQKDSVLHYVGDVEGKRILDLGCGDGSCCRMLKKKGAAVVVGVDISEFMIKMALEDEDEEPLGIQYLVQDVRMMNKLGDFDIVMGNLFLCYAGNQLELEMFANAINKNLITGGRFVSFSPDLSVTKFPHEVENLTGVSFTKIGDAPGGHWLKLQSLSPYPSKFLLKILCLNPEIYRQVFLKAGFREFVIRPVFLTDQTLSSFPDGFWSPLLNDQGYCVLTAFK